MIKPGQVWVHTATSLEMTVVWISSEGEVALRPTNAAAAAIAFPDEPFVKGQPVRCPFKKVDVRMTKATDGPRYVLGDFLAHEKWSVWRTDMSLVG